MRYLKFFQSVLSTKGDLSSKSLTLLVSAFTGGFLILVVGFCLIWDVTHNGYIKTDLGELGLFVLFVGGYIAGSGINKAVADREKTKIETKK